eukprot:TRINITY_DN25894_c0_g1_i1.p1 TRINITY_DN25894_c0_g1~~TRINITY_DN25894_c0_g1_i1.p1  ORF type:complete len:290 (+),score=22.80 TRINITY_DN25894_c0_g1_i1:73-942(+)
MATTSDSAVDVWMQHPTKAFLTDSIFDSLHRWNRQDPSKFTDEGSFVYKPSATLQSMDAGNVHVGLVCAWYGPQGPLITNEDVRRLCELHPDRFRGVASADIRDPVKAVDEIRHYVQNHGFVAVRILPWLWERFPTDPLFYPIYAECARLQVPICMQVGHTGPLRPSEMGRPIPYLERVLLDFPSLAVVGGHIGAPWTHEMIFLADKFPNLYIDTSAYVPSRFPHELVEYIKGRGRARVMFGSNFPMIQHALLSQQLDTLKLSDEVKKLYLIENAKRVFKLGDLRRAKL